MVKLKPEEERKKLVETLQAYGALRSPKVVKAMLKVPREMFVLESMKDRAYDDTPLPILSSQTISAPHMVAMMCELLELEVGHRVLEVGAGSGYHAAVVAETIAPEGVEDQGHVYTVEILPELVRFATENLKKTSYAKVVTVIQGDGSLGLPSHAPFDRIFVTASAPSVPPPLVEQLKLGGILVIPVGGAYLTQTLRTVRKRRDGGIESSDLMGVAFVPLRGEYGWKR